MVDFIMKTLFPNMLAMGEKMSQLFTYSLADFVSDIVNKDLNLGIVGDFSLIGVAFGGGLVAFVGYTVVKWITDIVL